MEMKTFLKIWIVVFTATVLFLVYQNRQQAQHNSDRINDIQASRIESCRANYNALLQAFAPFKPKKDDPNTPRDEVQDFKDFTNNLIKKKSHCIQQVRAKP